MSLGLLSPENWALLGVKVGIISSAEHFIAAKAFPDVAPFFTQSWSFAVTLAFILVVIDTIFIYPALRSPLKNLPTYNSSVLTILNEQPRGKTPLKWMTEHPEADMIRGRGVLGGQPLFLASPAALRDVLGTNSYDFQKTNRARSFLGRIIGIGLILAEGDSHKRQRKALTPAFHVQNIRVLYALMWEKTGIFVEQLGLAAKAEGHIEMSGWASRLTLDIIGPAALSRDFKSMTSGEHPIAEAFAEILEPSKAMLAYMASCFLLPEWMSKNLPVKPNSVIKRNSAYLRAVCGDILAEKKVSMLRSGSEKIDDTDIMSTIIAGKEFQDDEVVDQMLTFLAAGHETTSSALTWLTYLLCQNPHVQEKLREEIRAWIPSPSAPITHDLLEAMPYLNGVCEETLRLFPTVPMSSRGAVRDTTIAGQRVPKGTFCIIPIYAINRNPRFWGANAAEMVPERWIDTAADGTQRPNKHGGAESNFCITTFLHGQRSCIGQAFAKAELRCAVAGVFGKFAVRMLDPNEEVVVAGSVTTKPRNGMRVILEPVEGW